MESVIFDDILVNVRKDFDLIGGGELTSDEANLKESQKTKS